MSPPMSLPTSRPVPRPSSSRRGRRLAGALASLLVPTVAVGLAFADDPTGPSPVPGTVPSPVPAPSPSPAPTPTPIPAPDPALAMAKRVEALDHEIHHLEAHVEGLRRLRAELAAGKAEASPSDDAGRRAHDASQRVLREIQRYESSRSRAMVHLAEALAAKDEAKTADARSALARLDDAFVASVERSEASGSDGKRTGAPKTRRTSPKSAMADAGDGDDGKGGGTPDGGSGE